MDAIKKAWVDKTYDAILKVERYLGIKGEEKTDFSRLSNWIYSTDMNLHGFMPAGWEGAKESAQSFAHFLHVLHIQMIDEGSLIFVETEIHGSFMIFGVDEDDSDRILEIYDKRHPSTCRRPFKVHADLQRFFEHLEAYELYSAGGEERHAQRMKAIENASGAHSEAV